MAEHGYNLLNTGMIQKAVAKRDDILQKYDKIDSDYDAIVKKLLDNWKGDGAEAFEKDAQNVKANLTGVYEILKIMCDTLQDCLSVFQECNAGLEEYNRNPKGENK